jgi:hypothetical protein
VNDGGFWLTVHHRSGAIREYFNTITSALLRQQELENLLTAARGFSTEKAASACPHFES